MSQITRLRWQESEKLLDACNFSILFSVLNIKAAHSGKMDLAYIREGMVLADNVVYDKVKIAIEIICQTIVTGDLITAVIEEVR